VNTFTTIAADFNASLHDTWLMMPNWKWIGLAAALLLGFSLLGLLRPTLQAVVNKISSRTPPESWLSYLLREQINRPLAWVIVAAIWIFALQALALPENMWKFLNLAAQLILSFSLIRLAYLGVSALGNVIIAFVRKTENTLDDQLAPFITRSLKITVVVLGILVMLQNFGINVMSILAGLGLGGLALALAAQDTAANVFGSITIILDRPFQIGDYIKVADTEGTVEDVGFRSTRLRTPYNSLITVPNSVMAKEKIDNFQLRPTRRIRHSLGFTYDAKKEQIERFIALLTETWENHPDAEKGSCTVAFASYGDFSLNVLAQVYIRVSDWQREMKAQQELLFEAMRVAQQAGLQFAFPTQTLYHVLPNEPVGPRPSGPTPPGPV
jgi:MscS family membrane protein